jgi:hypothetical protein
MSWGAPKKKGAGDKNKFSISSKRSLTVFSTLGITH